MLAVATPLILAVATPLILAVVTPLIALALCECVCHESNVLCYC